MLSPLSQSVPEGLHPPTPQGLWPESQAAAGHGSLGNARGVTRRDNRAADCLHSRWFVVFASKKKKNKTKSDLTADWQVKENEKGLQDRSNSRQKPAL